MSFPFVIDNLSRPLADALSELLEQSVDRPLDIATAYFSIGGYRSASGRLLLDSCVWGYRHGPEGSGWTNKLIGHHS